PSLLQVGDEAGERLVRVLREAAVLLLEVVVVVPGLAGAGPDLHHAHAALEETAGHEERSRLRARAVEVADRLRLLREVERLGRLELHARRELEGLDARFEL